MICSLYEYIEENGYPRQEFEVLNHAGAKTVHASVTTLTNTNKFPGDGFYIWINPSHPRYPFLVKVNKGKSKLIDTYHKNHLVNSVIKNIFLNPYTPENDESEEIIKALSGIYVFYYHTFYNSYKVLTMDEITEGVIFHLSKSITTMIQKEHTTYREYDNIDKYISTMQLRLSMERIHDEEVLHNIGASLRL